LVEERGFELPEAIISSKLVEAAKKGAPWAICFFLKSRCGWRETADPAPVNVNIHNGMPGAAGEDQESFEQEQRALMKLMTPEELRQHVELTRRLALRRQQQREAKNRQPAIETTA
jgi:hypothetical protein